MGVFTKPPVLIDGETAFADDVNILSDRTEAAFDLVEFIATEQAVAASLFADAAEAWASRAEDVEVEVGKYSALHYAEKASDSASAASGSASAASGSASAASGSASAASGSASSASGFASNASSSATLAQKWATEAEDVEVTAGFYSSYHWAQKAEEYVTTAVSLISDTVFGVSWNGVTTIAPSKNAVYDQMILKANLASPALTGDPTAPTQAASDNSTKIATTAHVKAAAVQKTSSTGSAVIPSGTTAQQDAVPAAGYMRFNTTEEKFEGYNGAEWDSLGGGGLEWVLSSIAYTTEAGVGTMLDTSGGSKTVTLHATPDVGDTVAVADLKGTFAQYNVTISRNSMLIQGEAEDLLLDQKNQRVTLVYSGATDGWIITELEPNGSQFEYMPYAVFQVQDQKADGVPGGTNVVGIQTRTLNTVLTNEIPGASLTSNQVTLPAGEYDIEGWSVCDGAVGEGSKAHLYSITDSTYLASGNPKTNVGMSKFSYHAVFTVTTTLEVRFFTKVVTTNIGLGRTGASGYGYEVYTDLKITKIGGNYAPKPIVSVARYEPMAGLSTTGGVMGFDISKTGANQLTVTKGVCLDSNLSIALTLTADTALAIPAVANTIYHIFVVRLVASGLFSVRAYTTEAGVASDTDVDAFRWVGFWRTNGSSECVAALLVSGIFTFMKFSEATFISAYTVQATYQQLDASAHIPLSRAEEVMFDFQTTSTSTQQAMGMSVDGIYAFWGSLVGNTTLGADDNISPWNRFGAPLSPVIGVGPFVSRSSNSSNSTVNGAIHKVKLRR